MSQWISKVVQTTNIGPAGVDAIVYDDIQGSLSSAKIPAASAPTWRLHDYGIVAGVDFYVLGFTVGDLMHITVQTSHSMKLNTILDNHIHYTVPTDAVGQRFQFQLDVIAAGVGGTWAVPAGSPFTSEHTLGATEAGVHSLLDIADIPAVNTTVSSIYKLVLTRIAATVDEYGSEIYVDYNDGHYRRDTAGSLQEGSKV